MIKQQTYKDIWIKLQYYAARNDDKNFWLLYADYIDKTERYSNERIALHKMTQRLKNILCEKLN